MLRTAVIHMLVLVVRSILVGMPIALFPSCLVSRAAVISVH